MASSEARLNNSAHLRKPKNLIIKWLNVYVKRRYFLYFLKTFAITILLTVIAVNSMTLINDEKLLEITNNCCALDTEVSHLIKLLWEVRNFKAVNNGSLLTLGNTIDELISHQLYLHLRRQY